MKQLLYSFSLIMMMLLTACSADELPTEGAIDGGATRSIGGRPTFRCKSLPLHLTKARNKRSISYSSFLTYGGILLESADMSINN